MEENPDGDETIASDGNGKRKLKSYIYNPRSYPE